MFLKPNLLKYVFVFGIFLSPFVFWPKALIPYEIPRVLFITRWVELLVILSLLYIKRVKKETLDLKLLILIVLFFSWTIICSILGVDFTKSVWGNAFRSDGLITLAHLILLSLFISLFWNKSWENLSNKAFSLAALGVASWNIFLGIRFYLLKDLSLNTWGGALGGTFGQPVFLAGFLLTSLPFTAMLFMKSEKRLFWLFVMLTTIAGILLTRSWATVAGIFVFFAGWLILSKKRVNKLFITLLLLGIAVAGTFTFLDKYKIFKAHYFVPDSRERILIKAFGGVKEKPLFGWGWANFDHAFDSTIWPLKFNEDVYVDKAHSLLVEILVTTGIIGLTIYLFAIVKIAKNFHSIPSNYLYLLALITFVFHSQTNIISIGEELVFWYLVGVSLKGQKSGNKLA